MALLARIRLGEHALRESEQGWGEREGLCRMLGTDVIQDAAAVVERRPGTGMVRLGVPRVEVFTL